MKEWKESRDELRDKEGRKEGWRKGRREGRKETVTKAVDKYHQLRIRDSTATKVCALHATDMDSIPSTL